jgi:hypothetical protein
MTKALESDSKTDKPVEKRAADNDQLNLVALSQGDKGRSSDGAQKSTLDTDSFKGGSFTLAGPRGDQNTTVLDFTPDPYKSSVNRMGDRFVDKAGDKFGDKAPDKSREVNQSGDNPASKSVDERIADGRKAMNDLAEKHMTQKYPSIINGKMYSYDSYFKKDMEKFEDRVKSGDVPKEEVARTYEAISKMVDSSTDVTSRGQRLQLAKNIMFHAGDPTSTDQGRYQTCAVTTQQERMFTRNPGQAAEIISEAATTGKWVAPDGKEIKLDRGSLKPQPESVSGQPIDGERSYATQIMNNVLANDIHQRKANPEYYVQLNGKDRNGRRLGEQDSGERVYGADGKEVRDPEGKKLRAPQLDDVEISDQMKRLSGDSKAVLIHKNVVAMSQESLQHENPAEYARQKNNPDYGKNVNIFDDQQKFADALKELKEQKKFPAIIGLDGGNKEIVKGLPKEAPGQPDGPTAHMLSITDYDAEKGRVRLSNQWGKASDRWISIKALYDAANPGNMADQKTGHR